MAKTEARWNGKVIAASDHCIAVEGNSYFPPQDLVSEHFKAATQTSVCPWKGTANYFDVVVDGKANAGAAWAYNEPKAAAAPIKGYVAFWRGVEVTGVNHAIPMAR